MHDLHAEKKSNLLFKDLISKCKQISEKRRDCLHLLKAPLINKKFTIARFCFTDHSSVPLHTMLGTQTGKNILCVKSVGLPSHSSPHFPAFRLNTERYKVYRESLRIQSECCKMWTRITLNTDTFHALLVIISAGYKAKRCVQDFRTLSKTSKLSYVLSYLYFYLRICLWFPMPLN